MGAPERIRAQEQKRPRNQAHKKPLKEGSELRSVKKVSILMHSFPLARVNKHSGVLVIQSKTSCNQLRLLSKFLFCNPKSTPKWTAITFSPDPTRAVGINLNFYNRKNRNKQNNIMSKLSFLKRLEINITYPVFVVYHGFAKNTTLSLKLGNDVEGKSYLFRIVTKVTFKP